jgi:type VI secretion system secreted protein Hcp
MARPRLTPFAAALALSLLAPGAVHAATSIYLDLPGATGTSTNNAHPRWVEAQSLQFGVNVEVLSTLTGSARAIGKPAMSDLVWSQALDISLPGLLGNAITGAIAPTSTFDLVAPGSLASKPYLQLKAEKAVVTDLSLANSSVSGSLGYTKLSMTYDPTVLGGTNATDKAVTTTYDRLKNLVVGPAGAAPKFVSGSAPAAQGSETSMYLRLGSGTASIAGDSRASGYENWIKIDSAQMGVSTPYNLGAAGGAGVGKASISDLTWSQSLDKSVPVVLADLLRGTTVTQATIEYVTAGASGPVTFMQLALDNVMFSSLSLSTGGDLPSVSGSMNFTGFSETVWSVNADGSRGTARSFGYDILRRKPMGGSLAANVTGFGNGNLAPLALGSVESPLPAVGLPTIDLLPVPEPQSWALMLAGGALLAGLARRRS